jgi:hypothetical protein
MTDLAQQQAKIDKVIKYLKMAESESLSDRAAAQLFFMRVDSKLLKAAKAEYRGERSLSQKKVSTVSQNEAKQWWEGAVKKFKEDPWVPQALAAAEELEKLVPPYIDGVENVAKSFDGLAKQHIGSVDSKAKKVAAELRESKADLKTLMAAVTRAVSELKDYGQLGELLAAQEPPQDNVQREAYSVQIANGTQKCRRADQELQRTVQVVNQLCIARADRLRELIKEIVTAAIAWRKTESFRKGAKTVQSVANGLVEVSQLVNPEPISATAVQGLHMLFKGICDGATLIAAAVKSSELSKEDLDDLLDKLNPDDIVQRKIDLIVMAISWAAEPLGFIPCFGTLLRSCVNAVTEAISGTIKKAAEKQAAAQTKSKAQQQGNQPPPNVSEDVEMIKKLGAETVEGVANELFDGLGEGAQHIHAAIQGSADLEVKCGVAEFAISVGMALFGPAVQEAVADAIGTMDLVDKDQIKAKLQETRDNLASNSGKCTDIQKYKITFACDLEDVRKKNRDAIVALKTSTSAITVKIGIAASLTETSGVILLIGEDHADDTMKFFKVLEDANVTHSGTVKYQKNRVLPDTVQFSGLPEDLVRDYVKAYGTGDNRITGRALEFA